MTLQDLRDKLAAIPAEHNHLQVLISVELTLDEPLDEIEATEELAAVEIDSGLFGASSILLRM